MVAHLTFTGQLDLAADDGPPFEGTLPPPDVPPDPTGHDWRGLPGADGPPGPPGAAGAAGADGTGGLTEAALLRAASTKTGIIVPAYFYPGNIRVLADVSDGAVASRTLLDLLRQYHDVPAIIIVNQSGATGTGGPGPAADGNIEAAIQLYRATGAMVCGYVDTTYGARAEADVIAEIALWRSLYPAAPVDGVFFDQMMYPPGNTSDGGATYTDLVNVEKYVRYYDAAHAAGMSLVIGNPGSDERREWYDTRTADIIVLNETNSWPSADLVAGRFTGAFAGQGGHSDYDYRFNAILMHSLATWDQAAFDAVKPYVKWVYSTDGLFSGGASNPWAVLSSYVAETFAACNATQQPIWNAGTVTTLGANLALASGTLSATDTNTNIDRKSVV